MSMYMKGGRRKCEQNVCLASRHVRSKLSVRKMKGEHAARQHNRTWNGTISGKTVEASQFSPSVINLTELLWQSQRKFSNWMQNDRCSQRSLKFMDWTAVCAMHAIVVKSPCSVRSWLAAQCHFRARNVEVYEKWKEKFRIRLAALCPSQGMKGQVYDRWNDKVWTEGMFVFKARKVQVKFKEDERKKEQMEVRQHNGREMEWWTVWQLKGRVLRARMVKVKCMKGERRKCEQNVSQFSPSVINLSELFWQPQMISATTVYDEVNGMDINLCNTVWRWQHNVGCRRVLLFLRRRNK